MSRDYYLFISSNKQLMKGVCYIARSLTHIPPYFSLSIYIFSLSKTLILSSLCIDFAINSSAIFCRDIYIFLKMYIFSPFNCFQTLRRSGFSLFLSLSLYIYEEEMSAMIWLGWRRWADDESFHRKIIYEKTCLTIKNIHFFEITFDYFEISAA